MKFKDMINKGRFVAAEGAVIERVRREFPVEMDPYIAHAGLIYHREGKKVLTRIYRQYADIARDHGMPMILLTPTWRASRERLGLSGLSPEKVNGDCCRFLSAIRREYRNFADKIYIGGLMGCRGDAYRPGEALGSNEAYMFHRPQAQDLAGAGVDFIMASTLPAVTEAHGLARAMAGTGKPYIISFVVRPNGVLLDGTPLCEAVSHIDSSVSPEPAGYMVNCVHPDVFRSAVTDPVNSSPQVRERLLGLQANTSAKSPEELDGLAELDSEDPSSFASLMAGLIKDFGLKVMGGCCGTDHRHIRSMVEMIAQ